MRRNSGPAWGAARRTGAFTTTAYFETSCGASTPTRLAAAHVGPRYAWIGPRAGDRRRHERTRPSPFTLGPTELGSTRRRLLRPDDRVQTN